MGSTPKITREDTVWTWQSWYWRFDILYDIIAALEGNTQGGLKIGVSHSHGLRPAMGWWSDDWAGIRLEVIDGTSSWCKNDHKPEKPES